MELGQLLQFLDDWLATDRDTVCESLARFVGCDVYGVHSLRHGLARFTFLLSRATAKASSRHTPPTNRTRRSSSPDNR